MTAFNLTVRSVRSKYCTYEYEYFMLLKGPVSGRVSDTATSSQPFPSESTLQYSVHSLL